MKTQHLLIGTIALWITSRATGNAQETFTRSTSRPIVTGENFAGANGADTSTAQPNGRVHPPQTEAIVFFENWAERYVNDSSNARAPGSVEEGLSLARQRRADFVQLMKSDPEAALAHAIPNSLRQWLPLEITAELETPVSGIGDLMAFCAMPNGDQNDSNSGGLYWKVLLNGQLYRVFFNGQYLSRSSKFQIPLQGFALDGIIALDERALSKLGPGSSRPSWDPRGDFARPLVGSAPGATTSSVLVVRADFFDLPGDPRWIPGGHVYTAPAVQAVTDGEIAPYYRTSSYSNLTVNFTVTPKVYRLPSTAAFYATNGYEFTLYCDALAAAESDYVGTNYDKVMVLCSWLGSIPNSQLTFGGVAVIGGSTTLVNGEFDFRVVAHELGHTFGLFHADFWESNTQDPVSTDGGSLEYSDPFDAMSANWNNDHRVDFNPWFKNQLGWIHDEQVQTVSSNGVYRVYRFDDAAATGTLALKLAKDSTRDYWIGFRRNFAENPGLTNGAYVVWGYHQPQASDLLGLGPVLNRATDPGLRVGTALVDTEANVTIRPLVQGGVPPKEYLDLEIAFGPIPPPLRVSSADGRLVLSWRVTGTDFILETRKDLSNSEGWVPVTHQPVAQEGNLVFTNLVQTPAAFFRLRKYR
jgi:hypothetical protein